MQQPFQFSLSRFLVAIALIAVSLWLLRVARESTETGAAASAAIPLMLGAAIGSFFGRAGVGAIAVVVMYCVLGCLLVQREDEPLINGRRRGIFERRRFSVVSANDDRPAGSRAAPNKVLPHETTSFSPRPSNTAP